MPTSGSSPLPSTSAPASTSNLIISRSPYIAAKCNGAALSGNSRASRSAPRSMSRRAAWCWLRKAAKCSAVAFGKPRPASALMRSGRASSRCRSASTSPDCAALAMPCTASNSAPERIGPPWTSRVSISMARWRRSLAIWKMVRPSRSGVAGSKPDAKARRTASISPARAASKTRSCSARRGLTVSTCALSARQLLKP